jgi:LysM repeat protein
MAAAEPAPIDGNIYVIQAGDTLDALGRRLGIPWQRIAEYNGITDPTLLQVGQVVEIPGRAAEAPVVTTEAAPPAEPAAPPPPPPAEAAAPAPVDAAAPAPSEPAPAPAAPAPAVKPTIHTVRAGESLATIAPRYGLSWQTLAAMNGLDSRSVLQVGQVLRLHGTAPAAPAAPASAGTATTHTVRAGESLATIAPRYGFTWQELAALNGLDGQTILQVGQVLRLTRASPAAPASSGKPATVTVRKGDSLYSLATRFRIDWQDLARVNGLTGKSTLQVGQVLRLP